VGKKGGERKKKECKDDQLLPETGEKGIKRAKLTGLVGTELLSKGRRHLITQGV